jgi:hypothetical protein
VLLYYYIVDVAIFQLKVVAANNEKIFAEAGDANVSSRRFKIDAFLHYRLEPGQVDIRDATFNLHPRVLTLWKVLGLRLRLRQRLLPGAGVMRDDIRGARLPERGEEDLVGPDLKFSVLKNELAARRGGKIREEYIVGEHHGLGAVPQLNVA